MYRHLHRLVSFVNSPLTAVRQALLVTALLLYTLAAQAQTIFPVQSTTRILPPYSVYLADYAVNGNNKLQCILVNRDATQTTYQVRLRLTVKLNGRVIMQTSPNYNPPAITLTPQMAQVFAGATLEPYLKSENLEFVGYSQDLYEQNRALPEGFYEIGFAAFDYNRQDVQVSNDGYGFYFLAKNEPPLLNLPACNSKLQAQYSTPIRFTWMPRNTASLNSSASTYYRFFIYEVNPRGTNPNDIANSLPPIYVDSTPINQTFYDLMPTPVLFRDTFEYVWRVQAVDFNGADLFRNNGVSEVCTFTWGGPGANPYGSLDSVLSLNAIGETERKGKMWWTKDLVKFDGYKVYYKKSGSGYSWFTSETEADTLRVFDLQPDTEYECRIQGRKNGSYGMYSDVRYFRTKKIIPVECNNVTNVPVANSGRPLAHLALNTVLTYRDFEIRATDSIVAGAPGWFSGKGEVSLPFLGGMVFAVKFNNIYIDDAGMVSQGEVQFVSRDIQDWWKERQNMHNGGDNQGDVITGEPSVNYKATYDILSETAIQPVLPLVDGLTNIIILKADGSRDTLKNVSLPHTIMDKDGDIYQVDQKGVVTNIGKSNPAAAVSPAKQNGKLRLDKAKVTFKAHPAQTYAFDEWQELYVGKNIVAEEFEVLTDSSDNSKYYVSNKAIGASGADKVIAKIEITDTQNYKADSIKFITGTGTILKALPTSIANEYAITLVGGPGGDAQELFALYPGTGGNYTTIGKLKIPAYDKKVVEIVVVPVQDNTANINDIKTTLNKIYGGVNVQVNIRVEALFNETGWDANGDNLLEISGSGLLSQYTPEMKLLNKQYSDARRVERDKYYFFILKEGKDATAEGAMPRGKKFGYLFTKPHGGNADKMARTIAHELSHGAFNLKHTFDNSIGITQGTTSNLLDYNSGIALYKYQWDQIHDPGTVAGMLESDGDGMLFRTDFIQVKDYLMDPKIWIEKNLKDSVNYVAPDGRILTLSAKAQVSFSSYLVTLNNETQMSPLSKDAAGVVTAFVLNNKDTYYAYFTGAGVFKGYFCKSLNQYYGKISAKSQDFVVIGREFNTCQVQFLYGNYQVANIPTFSSLQNIEFANGQFELIGVQQVNESRCVLCTQPMETKPQTVKDVLNAVTANQSPADIAALMTHVSAIEMQAYLCASDKFNIIKKIVQNDVVNDAKEMMIINLISTTPESQAKDLIKLFDEDKTGILASLHTAIDGPELDLYYAAMSGVYFKSLGYDGRIAAENELNDNFEAWYKSQPENFNRTHSFYYRCAEQYMFVTKRMFQAENGEMMNMVHYTTPMEQSNLFDKDNNVHISFKRFDDFFHRTYRGRPFKLIRVYQLDSKGVQTEAYMPAMCMALVPREYERYDLNVLINKLVATLSTATILGKGGFWIKAWATVDLVVSNGNLYILANNDELTKTPEGRAFMNSWAQVNKYVAITQGVALWYNLGKNYAQYKLAIDNLTQKYAAWSSKELNPLRQTNAQLAEILESFGKEGLRTLRDLEAAYELFLNKVMAEFNVSRTLAEKLAKSDHFLYAYNRNKQPLSNYNFSTLDNASDAFVNSEMRKFRPLSELGTAGGATYDEFINSVEDFSNGQKAEFIEEAFRLTKEEKWAELEQLFKANGINKNWPPLSGATNAYEEILSVGKRFDRYQKTVRLPKGSQVGDVIEAKEVVFGSYFSPVGSRPITYTERALEGQMTEYVLEYEILIKQPINKTGISGTIIPWHGWKGGAIQTKFSDAAWRNLIEEGKIELTLKSSPSGMFEVLPNGKLKLLKLP